MPVSSLKKDTSNHFKNCKAIKSNFAMYYYITSFEVTPVT